MALDPRIRVFGPRVFLTKAHFQRLFGEDRYLEFESPLGTADGFVSRQRVAIATALGRIEQVPVMGPLGRQSFVECPRSLAEGLAEVPPVRADGDTDGSPAVTLIGPLGHVTLSHGLITAMRKIRVSPDNARRLGLMQQDTVLCLLRSERRMEVREAVRDTILGEVEVCISTDYDFELHIDQDDAAAAGVRTGMLAQLFGQPAKREAEGPGYLPVGRLLSEKDIRRAQEQGLRIKITAGMVLTPSARELGRELDLLDFA